MENLRTLADVSGWRLLRCKTHFRVCYLSPYIRVARAGAVLDVPALCCAYHKYVEFAERRWGGSSGGGEQHLKHTSRGRLRSGRAGQGARCRRRRSSRIHK